MNERIKELRKTLGLTQQELGDRIGIKRNTVAQYEIGRNEPIETVINLICREFNVNESWLRAGEGEMFVEVTRDEQIVDFIGNTLKDESDSFKRRFLSVLSTLKEDDWEALERIIEGMKKD